MKLFKNIIFKKEAYSYRTSQVEMSFLTISITEDLWVIDLSADSELIKLELKWEILRLKKNMKKLKKHLKSQMESSSQLKKELAEQVATAKTLELDLLAQRDVSLLKLISSRAVEKV